jgi:hypothetical protein
MKKQRHLVVLVVSAFSTEAILKANCRLKNFDRPDAMGPMVHCLKVCIAQEAGINLWEFSLMWDDRLLQDRNNIFCPRMAILRNNRHQLALQMVRHDTDARHVTMRRFPMAWITKPTFLDKANSLSTRFGDFVEIVDVSDQWRQDDDRDGERTLEVKYLNAKSGIMAMNSLNGVDIRSTSEKRSVDWKAPGKENEFVCLITGSPVVTEWCDCGAGDCRALCRIVWRPIRCPCSFGWRRPPPGTHIPPAHLLRATPKARQAMFRGM